jgi:hypothetical protein
MDLAIPYQKLEVGKIHIVPQPNGYLPFHYKDGGMELHKLFVISPVLTVANYNHQNGRLDFEPCENTIFMGKISALQEVLKATLLTHQRTLHYNCSDVTQEDIEKNFKNLFYNGRLSCYINLNQAAIKVHDAHGFTWQSPNNGIFQTGRKIRLCLKFSGIKKLIFNNSRGGSRNGSEGFQYRIDHAITAVYVP